MNPTAFALATAVLLLLAVLQISGQPTILKNADEDPAYQSFANEILIDKQVAEYKLNISRDTFLSNTKTFNIPEFNSINTSLTECLNNLKSNYSSDADILECLDSSEDVQQVISDSENELVACTNLTHGWELIGELLQKAGEALTSLDEVVNNILNDSKLCVQRYSNIPAKKNKCFRDFKDKYATQWSAATSLVQEAYYQISGGGLLLGAEVKSCQNAENITLTDKCNAMTSELLMICATPSEPGSGLGKIL